ncbi:MAG TPA: tetratricopeptide repeat protein [Gaiellaceae bacterium]|nr:tetratricopeptide repeat protein [Gaiellaceae bacterium]
MKIVRLDEIEGIPVFGTLVWKPVRRPLGITAFGINAYTAANAGDEVVEEHDEATLGHEEVYAVIAGHALFTVDGEEVDAPAGTLVYLDDPKQTRHAVAKEPNTTVLAIGGVPGKHEPSTWEYFFPALPLMREGRYAEAKAVIESGFADKPDHEVLLYHLARAEAALGEKEAALEHLNAAVAKAERLRGHLEDEHFDSIRDDPRFPSAK